MDASFLTPEHIYEMVLRFEDLSKSPETVHHNYTSGTSGETPTAGTVNLKRRRTEGPDTRSRLRDVVVSDFDHLGEGDCCAMAR